MNVEIKVTAPPIEIPANHYWDEERQVWTPITNIYLLTLWANTDETRPVVVESRAYPSLDAAMAAMETVYTSEWDHAAVDSIEGYDRPVYPVFRFYAAVSGVWVEDKPALYEAQAKYEEATDGC